MCAGVFSACTSGPMDVDEKYFLVARNDQGDANYYRVRISGATRVGDAKFRQGWYPADAVDAVFGELSAENEGKALATETRLRSQLDDAFVAAQEQYLKAALASDPPPDPDVLRAKLEVFNNIRKLPPPPREGADRTTFIEYNPRAGLELRRSGQKPVMILSSDPDEIINKIVNVAEDAKTQELWYGMSEVLKARELAKTASEVARQEVLAESQDAMGVYLRNLQQELATAATGSQDATRSDLLAKLNAVIALMQSQP